MNPWLYAFTRGLQTVEIDTNQDQADFEFKEVFLYAGQLFRLPGPIGVVKIPMTGYWSVGQGPPVWLGES